MSFLMAVLSTEKVTAQGDTIQREKKKELKIKKKKKAVEKSMPHEGMQKTVRLPCNGFIVHYNH